jgi:hypothetical protein
MDGSGQNRAWNIITRQQGLVSSSSVGVESDDYVFKKWMMNSSRRGPKGKPPKLLILSISIDNTSREMFESLLCVSTRSGGERQFSLSRPNNKRRKKGQTTRKGEKDTTISIGGCWGALHLHSILDG